MVDYGSGQVGNVNVPKKAVAAMDIIYNASALLSVMDKAGIPSMLAQNTEILFDATKGVQGEDNVAIDAAINPNRVAYKQIKTSIVWSNYEYDILEGAKLNSRDPNAIWEKNMRSASEYFAAIKDYRTLSKLASFAMNSAAAGTTWGSAGADPEEDIVAGLSKIMEKSNMQSGEKISVIIPAKVFYEANKLTLINNIQRTVRDYLEKSFELQMFAYRPQTDESGTVVNDGLSTNALMFVQGRNTGYQVTFDPAEAARRKIIMIEQERMFARGERYVQKMGTACLPMWDGVGTYTSTTDYKNNRIYKITGVSS